MPLLVAGMVNLAAVPIGQSPSSARSRPPPVAGCGTASKATSEAFAPLPPELSTHHTTADDALTPAEVTTGEPEEKPKVKVLLAAFDRTGSPVLSVLIWKARM